MEGANQLWSEVFHTTGENYNTSLDVIVCMPLDSLRTGDNEGGDWEWVLRKTMNEQSP